MSLATGGRNRACLNPRLFGNIRNHYMFFFFLKSTLIRTLKWNSKLEYMNTKAHVKRNHESYIFRFFPVFDCPGPGTISKYPRAVEVSVGSPVSVIVDSAAFEGRLRVVNHLSKRFVVAVIWTSNPSLKFFVDRSTNLCSVDKSYHSCAWKKIKNIYPRGSMQHLERYTSSHIE